MFAVHRVFGNIFHRDRFEGALADMQCEFGAGDSAVFQFRQNVFGEMQSGGGSGDRAGVFCINSLIAFGIGRQIGAPADIRRQRNMSAQLESLFHIGFTETDHAVAVILF